jgi:hypothetical protein
MNSRNDFPEKIAQHPFSASSFRKITEEYFPLLTQLPTRAGRFSLTFGAVGSINAISSLSCLAFLQVSAGEPTPRNS